MKGSSGLRFDDIIHHGESVGHTADTAGKHRAKNAGVQLNFSFLPLPTHWMELPTFRMGFFPSQQNLGTPSQTQLDICFLGYSKSSQANNDNATNMNP